MRALLALVVGWIAIGGAVNVFSLWVADRHTSPPGFVKWWFSRTPRARIAWRLTVSTCLWPLVLWEIRHDIRAELKRRT